MCCRDIFKLVSSLASQGVMTSLSFYEACSGLVPQEANHFYLPKDCEPAQSTTAWAPFGPERIQGETEGWSYAWITFGLRGSATLSRFISEPPDR